MPSLPSWLSVLPMLHIDLHSCLSERSGQSHDCTVVAQRAERAGTDLWRRRGRLWWGVHSRRSWAAVCSSKTPFGPRTGSFHRSMPSHQFPPGLLKTTLSLSLVSSLLDKSLFLNPPSCSALAFIPPMLSGCVTKVSVLVYLSVSAPLRNPTVSIYLHPPASLSPQ